MSSEGEERIYFTWKRYYHISHGSVTIFHELRLFNDRILNFSFTTLAPSGARGGLFGAGGRFKGGTDPIMEKFNESISFDKRWVYT
jgi:hypothetical protein